MTARPLNPTAASRLGFLHEGPMSGRDVVATAHYVLVAVKRRLLSPAEPPAELRRTS